MRPNCVGFDATAGRYGRRATCKPKELASDLFRLSPMKQKTQESPIEMSRRHVKQFEDLIARQEQMVEKFRTRGWPSQLAFDMLSEYKGTLDDERAHLELLIEAQRLED